MRERGRGGGKIKDEGEMILASLKKNCSCSLARLMQSCSNELVSNFSNPKISKIPYVRRGKNGEMSLLKVKGVIGISGQSCKGVMGIRGSGCIVMVKGLRGDVICLSLLLLTLTNLSFSFPIFYSWSKKLVNPVNNPPKDAIIHCLGDCIPNS